MYLHPPSPGEEGGWQRLQGFLPLRGSVYVAWQSPGAPALSRPTLPCPKGHHSQALDLWGAWSCSHAGRAGEKGAWPAGTGNGVSDSSRVPSRPGNSRRAWAAGEQAFSVRAAHPALKHVPSVFWGVGPDRNPSGPSDCRIPTISHPYFISPSILSFIKREGLPADLGASQLFFFLISKILSIPAWAGPGKSLWLHPSSLSIPCPLRNEPCRRSAKLKILKCKPPPRECPRRVGVGLAPSVAPNPSSPYTLHSGIRHSPPRPTPPL